MVTALSAQPLTVAGLTNWGSNERRICMAKEKLKQMLAGLGIAGLLAGAGAVVPGQSHGASG